LASAEATLVNLKAPTRKERLDGLRAVLDELDARTRDRERDLARFTRLVEVDRTAPPRRLEEIRLELDLLKAQRAAAQARLDEAVNGPTPTEIALAEARVTEARTMLATAELDLKDTLVLAPFDGVITRRFKGLGDYVAGVPFVDVLELIGTTELEAELHLPEAFLTLMTPGKTRLRLKAQALEKELDLAVTQVVPRVNAQEGTFPVRADVPPAQRGGLTPGTFVTAEFQFERTESDVIVPLRAVFEESKDYYVVVAEEEKMLRRRVATSHRLTEGIVVKSGLRAGEKVVLGLKTLPRDGTPLPAELRSSQR
jgi:multidrug efflux pump subunit AcrA (membrane-fusion protein)